jgi:predicted amidophosphoribosyltransferase
MDFRFREIPYDEGKTLIRHKSGQTRNIPQGRAVLLLDDVATTGRTLSLHADVLKENGAKNIYAITLAKTGRPKE